MKIWKPFAKDSRVIDGIGGQKEEEGRKEVVENSLFIEKKFFF